MSTIKIARDSIVSFNGENYLIKRISGLQSAICERLYDGHKITLPLINLKAPVDQSMKEAGPTSSFSDDDWEIAKSRYEIIKPILGLENKASMLKNISKSSGIHQATLYRWIDRFESTELLSSLVPYKKNGGKGKGRIDQALEEIMVEVIENHFLKSQKINISQAYIELKLSCRKEQLEAPHINTFRRRVKSMNQERIVKSRFGKKKSDETFSEIRGHYNKATYPLSIVQIDHTLLDIILVDNETRRPIGRPWITVAIDVYSRMILGFYVSFDPPSSMSVGLCLSHSILPKEKYLLSHEVEGEWPCWGIMNTVHADNAKEFKGKSLKRACEEYQINIQWRPIATPHWGGHIERLIGSLNGVIHTLPGTTFSKHSERENYNSEKKATFSLTDIEKYLSLYIVEVYHKKIHSALQTSPIFKYKEGLLGSGNFGGYGLPAKVSDEDKLKKDFMPYFERTIQRYGVKIENVYYYHEVMRRWINATEPSSSNIKRKFIFCRDPRDITVLYFLDPENRIYYPIPCRDISRPSINIWEFRDTIKFLKDSGIKEIDEDKIFDAYERLNQIKESSNNKTRNKKRKTKEGRRNIHKQIVQNSPVEEDIDDKIDIKPFDDVDYGSY